VRGRSSDNRLIREKLSWAPSEPLKVGMEKTYLWINEQVQEKVLVPFNSKRMGWRRFLPRISPAL
jgi:GDP-D-mannose 3', 5'-epimerase